MSDTAPPEPIGRNAMRHRLSEVRGELRRCLSRVVAETKAGVDGGLATHELAALCRTAAVIADGMTACEDASRGITSDEVAYATQWPPPRPGPGRLPA